MSPVSEENVAMLISLCKKQNVTASYASTGDLECNLDPVILMEGDGDDDDDDDDDYDYAPAA